MKDFPVFVFCNVVADFLFFQITFLDLSSEFYIRSNVSSILSEWSDHCSLLLYKYSLMLYSVVVTLFNCSPMLLCRNLILRPNIAHPSNHLYITSLIWSSSMYQVWLPFSISRPWSINFSLMYICILLFYCICLLMCLHIKIFVLFHQAKNVLLALLTNRNQYGFLSINWLCC